MNMWQILVAVTCFLAVHSSKNVNDAFHWTTCDGHPVPSSWPAQLQKFSLTPDPVVLPGQMTLSFTIHIAQDISTPLKLDLFIAFKYGETWQKVPCIATVYGSCTYDDVCILLKNVKCPDKVKAAGLKCQCPFKAGTYTLPPFQIDIGESLLPSSELRIVANMSRNNKMVGCYNVTANIVDDIPLH